MKWSYIISCKTLIVSLFMGSFLLLSCKKIEPSLSKLGRADPVFYTEQYRPQFHFTPSKNWMNDPNGLVYHGGEYHLFYQYNPFGDKWGHMSWGHAVSEDLLHWEHLDVALKEENNVMIFSGSAVVDSRNTSGLGSVDNPPMVAIYTGNHTDRPLQDQRIAYSLDRGRTWTKYSGNPVIDEELGAFRDPKVFWHGPTEKWVMVVALPNDFKVRFYNSQDLINWEMTGEFGPAGSTGGVWECPDLFQLPVDSDSQNMKWVLQVDIGSGGPVGGSGAQYFIGEFDGETFVQDSDTEGKIRWADHGKDFYAVQSFANIPESDGRRIWLAWMSNWKYASDLPTSPWRSAMTIPREVTLKTINGSIHLAQTPVEEITFIRDDHHSFENVIIDGESNLLADAGITGKTLELKLRFKTSKSGVFGIKLAKGTDEETIVGYDTAKQKVFIDREKSGNTSFSKSFSGKHYAPLSPVNGSIELHILLDRSSVELFGNGGIVSITDRIFPSPESEDLLLFSSGGPVQIETIEVWPLNSVWN